MRCPDSATIFIRHQTPKLRLIVFILIFFVVSARLRCVLLITFIVVFLNRFDEKNFLFCVERFDCRFWVQIL